ncbi:MAG: TetR/AcrR family transcriptional regulator [Kiritimatiellia bacterium]|jgi:AcrR family transcriptional regulator
MKNVIVFLMEKKSEITKERILLVAAELFAGHGFQGTTHQMICSQAEVNIAAINYHFGNKETLYLKVWKYLFALGMQNYQEFVNDADSPEEQLRSFIKWRVRSVIAAGPRGYLSQIFRREMNKPSPVFDQIQVLYLNEKRAWFYALISKIVGHDLDASTITMAAFCIHSPLVHLVEIQEALKATQEGALKQGLAQFWEDPEALAESIYTFAVAGLKELRRKI